MSVPPVTEPATIVTSKLASTLLKSCVGAELLFLVLDYYVNYSQGTSIGALRRMSNIAREDGLASWFGTTQTLLAGLTLWLLYGLAKARGVERKRSVGWAVLAGFFTYMAVDDGAQLHERFGSTVKALRGGSSGVSFFPSYTWQVVFLPIFVGLGLFMVVFLWGELASRRARLLVVAAAGCMGFAVGLDFIEGLDKAHPLNAYALIADTWDLQPWASARFGKPPFEVLRHFSKAIEESFEMLAISVLWFVFVEHLGTAGRGVLVTFSPVEPAKERAPAQL